jgi:hypothetical protein
MTKLRTYIFAVFTFCYLLAVNGIPVYLHYCGGELEEISYLTKTNNCCGDEEENNEASDCCHNESLFLRSSPEACFSTEFRLAQVTSPLLAFVLFATEASQLQTCTLSALQVVHVPPLQLQQALINVSCLRI